MQKLDRELLKHNIETRTLDDLASGRVGGVAISVRQDGENAFRACFGKTAVGGMTPVTDRTVFRMASMTKPVTVVGALILAEEGKLSLNGAVEDYLPQFRGLRLGRLDADGSIRDGGAVTVKPTVRHLLTHSSGIGCGELDVRQRAAMTPKDRATLSASVDFYARTVLAFEPGTAQAYSGIAGFDILGKIMETVSGEDLETVLRRRVFEPCEMEDTTFLPTDAQWARMIAMHDYARGLPTNAPTTVGCLFEQYPAEHMLGGGGLASTLEDYEHFADMLLDGGVWKGRRIVSEAAITQMRTPALSASVQPGYKRWGFGVRVIVGEGYRVLPIGAYGWSGAYGTHFWVDPVNRITAIYLKNSRFDNGSGARTSYHFEEDVHAALII